MELYLPRFIEQKEPFAIGLKTTVSGKYKVEICRSGHVARRPFGERWLPNVITNAGLDALMQGTYFFQTVNAYCRAGSGTTTPAVTDTQLTTQLSSTNTKVSGSIGTSNDTVNGAVTHTMVFDFAVESGNVTYNEIGLASTAGPTGGNLYTHSLFSSGASLISGDNLRVTYALTFSYPATVTAVTVSLSAINGFNISGQLKAVGTFSNIFGSFSSSGVISGGNDANIRNSSAATAGLISAPTTFPSVNAALSGVTMLGNSVTGSLGTYTTGSFTRTQQLIWIQSNPSSTASNVNGILITANMISDKTWGLLLLLTATQTKANTNTLTVNLSGSIARA